ncbi:MAG: acyl-CoA dehydrogenase family protein [Herpetosiphon sp.]
MVDVYSEPTEFSFLATQRWWFEKVRKVACFCAAQRAAGGDEDQFPLEEFRQLAESGLLAAPVARRYGGWGLGSVDGGTPSMLALLAELGRGNLAVGRIFEGHVNALDLVQVYGTSAQIERYTDEAVRQAKLFAVWNTQDADGVHFVPQADGGYRLAGAKTFCSGATFVQRPIVTGALPDGRWQMCIVPLDLVDVAVNESFWRPIGMRASVSYRIDFTGVVVEADDLLGSPEAYYGQPLFGAGAMRFAAVQLGGAAALAEAMTAWLVEQERSDDPHQRRRMGEVAVALQTGWQWVRTAGELMDRLDVDAARLVAYATMCRTAVERVCLETMQLVERSVGARGLLQPHVFERVHRDLTMYLRQAAPDAMLDAAGEYALKHGDWVDQVWSEEALAGRPRVFMTE